MSEFEAKWLKKWEEDKVFESDPDGRKSFYLTVAYPYPSGGMHIGHARTYTVPDVIARFKRMQGFNVLFPMAWHVTGTPIIGALKRLKDGEEKQVNLLKNIYSMTDEEMSKINEPMDFANYFIDNHYRPSMKKLGYTIDWRRQFTTNDKRYNKFITWQFLSLHERGLVKKGLHPVKYCLGCGNPVTTHDLLDGDDAEVQEFTLLKFKMKDTYIIAATLRPETIYGQTNMWINPDVTYVKAYVDGEEWIISKPCAEKLLKQEKKVEVIEEIAGRKLIGKYCMAPGIDREIIILPSQFPNPKIGSGLVTSVPSDAPYDWIALLDLQKNPDEIKKYNLDIEEIKSIETIPIIDIEGYGPEAAKDIVESMGIENQLDTAKLKEATNEVYKAGFHTGILNNNCGIYSGLTVVRAKEKIKQKLLMEGFASTMLEFSENVVCRCGGNVIVAKAESWFLDYGNEDWKEQARGAINNMEAIPERTKQDYLNTVDWLKQWPCIRNFGLGTKLPFDDRFMIEPLSDSTIYMAYYTIANLLAKLDIEGLTPDFFNFVFRGIGDSSEISKKCGLSVDDINEVRASFDYWYPQNFRCSALELIQNHLTFMLYHHVALFNADKWPKGIASFGMGLLEGAKMSSSKGNVILVKDAVDKFGSDVTRLFLMGNAEPWMDFDWRESLVDATSKRLRQFEKIIRDIIDLEGRNEFNALDDWLMSKVNGRIAEATSSLEKFQTRKALQIIFYEMFKDLSWYMRRGTPNKKILSQVCNTWIRLMTPFTPFICEEMWEIIGGEGYVSNAPYPVCDESKINVEAVAAEDYVKKILEDVQNIQQIMKSSPNKLSIYVAENWKYRVYQMKNEGKTIKDVMAEPEYRQYGKQIPKLMSLRPDEMPKKIFGAEKEIKILKDAKTFLEQELGFEVTINPDADPEGKKRFATPNKPGLYMS